MNVPYMVYMVLKIFTAKFLQGDGNSYLHPQELMGEEYKEHWYNALGWARSELRVDKLLKKGNPVGLWELTAEGKEAAAGLPADDHALYL